MSTYSPSLRIELITTGDQAGTWGTTTNSNLGTLIESAIAGYVSVSVTSANQALTALNGAADQSRNATIALTTTTTANFAVYAPPAEKAYTIYNASSYTATIYNSTVIGNTTAAGTGVAIPAGKTATVWSDGTNFSFQNNHLSSLTLATDLAVADGGTGASTATNARTNLGLVIGTDVQAYDAGLADIAGLAVTDGNIIVGNGTNWVAESGATARASLGLTIGTNVQAYDAGLADIAGLAVTDGNIIVGNGTNWVAESGATARASLGLTIGTNVQAYDAELTAIAALSTTDGNVIVGNGTTWVAESGSTARTSLGAAASGANSDITSLSGLTTALSVAQGGTGTTTSTGTGSTVLSASPTFTGTPAAPTASAGTNTTQLATTAFVTTALQALYPVGSVYINASSTTNPATLLGFGTWTAIGAGRVLVGQDTADTAFDTMGETGGSKTAIAVAHTHTFSATTASNGAHQHAVDYPLDCTSNRYAFGSTTVSGVSTDSFCDSSGSSTSIPLTQSAGAHTHTVSGTTDSTGSSGTNANLQPYVVVKMWQRTA